MTSWAIHGERRYLGQEFDLKPGDSYRHRGTSSLTDASASGLPGRILACWLGAPDTLWTTEYLGLAVAELRAGGRRIDDAILAHISPAHNENIAFYGTFAIEVDQELAQLVGGYRPLRPPGRRLTEVTDESRPYPTCRFCRRDNFRGIAAPRSVDPHLLRLEVDRGMAER